MKKENCSQNDIAVRFDENPLLIPNDVRPSRSDLKVECLLNPGVFRFDGKIWLLLRVAEAAEHSDKYIRIPTLKDGQIHIIELNRNDPDIDTSDPRVIIHHGKGYLTTLSHLRLAFSIDGRHFSVTDQSIVGQGPFESYGIEDCRVTQIGNTYYLTYTAVSEYGYGVGMISTADWQNFTRHGLILSGPNKDCAIFEEKINGKYYCLHRPSMSGLGGNYIWLAESNNLTHWGNHQCLAATRPGMWDSQRIGAGASPIKTEKGWLEIYHGADDNSRYCLGALLLDLENPSRILARSSEPIMEPQMEYEKNGFFGNVVFTNGHIVEGDTVRLYYGAGDKVICMAEFSIKEILSTEEKLRGQTRMALPYIFSNKRTP